MLINDGAGDFTLFHYPNIRPYSSSASGDFDNDGDIDIAIMEANTHKIGILLNGDIPLPVELASFTSEVNLNNVKLNWSTSGEQNNSVLKCKD